MGVRFCSDIDNNKKGARRRSDVTCNSCPWTEPVWVPPPPPPPPSPPSAAPYCQLWGLDQWPGLRKPTMVLPSPLASTVLARLSELMTTVWQNSHPMCSSLRYLSIKKQSNSNNYNRVARVALRVLFCYHLIWHADIRSWTWRIKSKTSTAI